MASPFAFYDDSLFPFVSAWEEVHSTVAYHVYLRCLPFVRTRERTTGGGTRTRVRSYGIPFDSLNMALCQAGIESHALCVS